MTTQTISLKKLQEFFLERRIRAKFSIHPVKNRIVFRFGFKDWNFLRHDAEFRAYRWAFMLNGWDFVTLPLLAPWECREQIAVYTYLD